MQRSTRIIILLLFYAPTLLGQSKVGEFDTKEGFGQLNEAAGYHVKSNNSFRVNLQIDDRIVRNSYDNNFKLTDTYEQQTKDYSLHPTLANSIAFSMNLELQKGVYEIYAGKRNVMVIAPDFLGKKDTVLYSTDLKDHENDEKRLAVMPYSKGLRILSFSNKNDKLFMYDWKEDGPVDTIEFSLPESSLTAEEIKTYTKSARVKYKAAFDDLIVSRADSPTAIGYPGSNYVYYTDDKIWLVLQTPLCTGFHMLEIDIKSRSVSPSNYFINDMRKNSEAKPETLKTPYALIWDGHLIIRNSTYYLFQYKIYDLATRKLIKEYEVRTDESLQKIVHSDLNQKGSWFSGGDEKKLDNEKAYLRKLGGGDGVIYLSKMSADSFTITTGSVKKIEGLTGTLVKMGTGFMGAALNLVVGPFQIIPYLQLYRNKLVYSHSTFSRSTLEPSVSKNTTTPLDLILDNFERRDIKYKSSFILLKNEEYFVGVYSPVSKKIELYSL